MAEFAFTSHVKVGEHRYRERYGLDFEDFVVGQVFKHRPGLTLSQQDNVEESLDTLNQAMLHFDAHSDTRKAYQGFTWSHASILYNALENIPEIKKVVQVGIRDFSEEEWDYCQSQKDRVSIFLDQTLKERQYSGTPFSKLAEEIVSALPEKIWISFDIDGLDPRFCPHTGTPVPGGLDFSQAVYLMNQTVDSGRKIIGFDLVEVAPDPSGVSEWDANVGARLLYKMTAAMLSSQGKIRRNL